MEPAAQHGTEGDVQEAVHQAVIGLLVIGDAGDDGLEQRRAHRALKRADPGAGGGPPDHAFRPGQGDGVAGRPHHGDEGRSDVQGIEGRNAKPNGEHRQGLAHPALGAGEHAFPGELVALEVVELPGREFRDVRVEFQMALDPVAFRRLSGREHAGGPGKGINRIFVRRTKNP